MGIRCIDICEAEEAKWENGDMTVLKTIINAHYPDIRKIINTIQGSTVDGIVKLDKASLKNDLNEQIINALSNKILLQEIRQILADSGSREFVDFSQTTAETCESCGNDTFVTSI